MKTLLTEQQVQAGVRRMVDEIAAVYGDRPLTIVGVLTGSVVLLADMIRLLTMPLRVGVVQASSYRGATRRGPLVINSDLMPDIASHDVLVVDDIFDTGHTLVELLSLMAQLGPTSMRTAVLLRKSGQQQVTLQPDFVGFDIPNEFVVGYGLDYRDMFRNLPYVAALEPEDIGELPDGAAACEVHEGAADGRTTEGRAGSRWTARRPVELVKGPADRRPAEAGEPRGGTEGHTRDARGSGGGDRISGGDTEGRSGGGTGAKLSGQGRLSQGRGHDDPTAARCTVA